MPVLRVILRVDCNTIFDLMDRPGQVVQTILETAGRGYFDTINELPQTHEIRAISKSKTVSRQVVASPTFVLLDYQNFEGIGLKAIQNEETFATLCNVVTAIRKLFKIEEETRAGLRLFYVNHIAEKREAVHAAFQRLMDAGIQETAEKHLGKARDLGIAMDCRSDDVTSSFRVGPFLGKTEAVKYFLEPPADCEILDRSNFIVDLDQYQLAMKRSPDLKWWKPLLQSANGVISALESEISEKLSK
jgi:hypothetical protein